MPRVPWETISSRVLEGWRGEPGRHITVIGPTGSGKSHLALCLAELRPYIIVLATKRQDPLVDELRDKGYLVTGDLDEVQWTVDEQLRVRRPVRPRLVFWPQFSERLGSRERMALQQAAHREAMDWADKTGKWAILIDESMWMAANLQLEQEMNSLWFQGRTQGIAVIACAQRPSRVPRLAFSQATYLFIGKFGDKRDIETLRDISSTIPKELVESAIRDLDFDGHEFLFIDTARNSVAVTVAPPR